MHEYSCRNSIEKKTGTMLRSLNVCLIAASLAAPLAAQEIPSPQSFFGFELGTDGEMARYD